MKAIRKIGLRRTLRLFWATYRKMYLSEADRDGRREGSYLSLALALGAILIVTPLICVIVYGWENCQQKAIGISVAFGIMMLSIPASAMISLWQDINRDFDRLLEEMR